MRASKKQQIRWLKDKRCHVCGSNQPHDHPQWMWLANPVPDTKDKKLKERIEFEKKANRIVLEKIVGAK